MVTAKSTMPIEALAKDGMRHILGVTEVRHGHHGKGVAQNIVLLESSLTMRKRKRNTDNNRDEGPAEVLERAYGIVTDAINWYFVECSIDQSLDSGEDCPKFRVSKLKDIINYKKDTWRAQAESVLSQIVWLMRKMHSEIPVREL